MSNTTPTLAEAVSEDHTAYTLWRWTCDCQPRPYVIARLDDKGRIILGTRNRTFFAYGIVKASCPHCKTFYTLNPFDALAWARLAGVKGAWA